MKRFQKCYIVITNIPITKKINLIEIATLNDLCYIRGVPKLNLSEVRYVFTKNIILELFELLRILTVFSSNLTWCNLMTILIKMIV